MENLEKKIHSHLEKIENIEDLIISDIEILINSVDMDKAIDNPQEELLEIARNVALLLKNKYSKQAVKAGIDLAKDVKS